MLELFPLPWIPFAWREGREGSYEEEVPFSPEKLKIKKKLTIMFKWHIDQVYIRDFRIILKTNWAH